jgi:uncharacterized protein YhdP
MRIALKCVGAIFSVMVLLLIVATLAFYHLIYAGELRRFLIGEIEAKTGFKVELGEADLAVGRILGIGFSDFALSEPDVARPAITAQRITARVALLPLFERKLILYGVRLHKPTAHLVRDKEGRIPLLGKILNLPFWTQEATQFGLDLHSIGIQGGEVDLEDQQTADGPRTTRWRDIDLDVQRMRDQKLLDFVHELAKLKRLQPQGPALDFTLRSEVETGNDKTRLRARGRVVLPEESLELQKSWWNADVELDNLTATHLRRYIGAQWPVKSLAGVFAPRVHVQGSLEDQIRLRGALSFTQLAIDAPDLFDAPPPPTDGQAQFDINWKPHNLGIALFDLRSKELRVGVKGEIRQTAGNSTSVQLNVSAPWLPVIGLRKYLPLKRPVGWPIESFVDGLQQGELQVNKLGINGTLDELKNITQSAAQGLVSMDAEFRDVGVNLSGEGYLPLRGLQGKIHLDQGTLALTDLKGSYGRSRLTDMNGTYQLDPEGQGNLDVRAIGDIDLAELHEQLKLGVFPSPVAKLSSSLADMGGRGHVQLNLQRSGESSPRFEGKVTLDNARLQVDEISLTEIRGDLALSPTEIRTEGLSALLSNSPVQIQLLLSDYAADDGSFDLRVDSAGVKAGIVSRLLLATGSLDDPGMVRGTVRYYGVLGQGERKFTGSLDLLGVKLDHKPLLQPLRDLSGRVTFDETGIDFRNLQGLLVGFPVEFGGRWRYTQEPRLVFSLAAPALDVGYLLSQIDPESTAWYDTLTAQGEVSLLKGRLYGWEFTGLNTELNLNRRVWRLENAAARSAGGLVQAVATIVDKPDRVGFALTPKIQGASVQGMLHWFEANQTEVTGKVNLTGKLESMGKDGAERKRDLNGALNLRIEDGTIHRLRLVVQILNLLDLSRWFSLKLPDLRKEGIRFRAITGDFTVQQGVFVTENLIVDSDDLRMTGSGKIDLANDRIDFVLAVRPFAGIDTAIGYIPLLGRGFAAIKNSFLVASFNINGPIEDPTITPAPLSTLSEWVFGVLGIPKNVIGWTGEDKKVELQNGSPNALPAPAATP